MPGTLENAPSAGPGAPPRTLSANDLRWLAEKADGLRGQPLFLVEDPKKVVDVVSQEELNGREPLLYIDTRSRGPGIPENPNDRAKARILCNGKIYNDALLDEADTLFLSQSSVEKFLLPYYMRFKSGAEVQAIENMLFNKEGVMAALHIPPSLPKAWPKIAALTPEGGTSNLICEIR
ncbi:MAG: hypothetical protein JWL97_1735 [Gemmatimonadales bacterium]|jgi:hypothetical protein|nr:hypothetical protein [Gemmatimonadales bacterium]